MPKVSFKKLRGGHGDTQDAGSGLQLPCSASCVPPFYLEKEGWCG